MISKYKHTFLTPTDTKELVINISSSSCEYGSQNDFTWTARGDNYSGTSTVTGVTGGILEVSASNIIGCSSVWFVTCNEDPSYYMEIEFYIDGCTKEGLEMSEALEELKEQIEEARKSIDDKVNSIESIASGYLKEDLKDALSAYDEAVRLLSERDEKVEAANKAIEDARDYLSSLKDNVGSIVETTVDEIGERLISASYADVSGKVVNYVNEELNAAEARWSVSASSINVLSGAVVNLARDIDAVSGSVKDYAEKVDTVNDSLTAVQSEMNASSGYIMDQLSIVSGNTANVVKDYISGDGKTFIQTVVDEAIGSSETDDPRVTHLQQVVQRLNGKMGLVETKMYGCDIEPQFDKDGNVITDVTLYPDSAICTDLRDTWSLSGKTMMRSITDTTNGHQETSYLLQELSGFTLGVIDGTDENGKKLAATIAGYINDGTSDITIEADKIHLLGDTIAERISAESALIGQIASESIDVSRLSASSITIKDGNKVIGGVNNGEYSFWSGGESGSVSNFSVDWEGNLKASNVNVSGTLGRTPTYYSELYEYDSSVNIEDTPKYNKAKYEFKLTQAFKDKLNQFEDDGYPTRFGDSYRNSDHVLTAQDFRFLGNFLVNDCETGNNCWQYFILPTSYGVFGNSDFSDNGIEGLVRCVSSSTIDYSRELAESFVGTKFSIELTNMFDFVSFIPSEFIDYGNTRYEQENSDYSLSEITPPLVLKESSKKTTYYFDDRNNKYRMTESGVGKDEYYSLLEPHLIMNASRKYIYDEESNQYIVHDNKTEASSNKVMVTLECKEKPRAYTVREYVDVNRDTHEETWSSTEQTLFTSDIYWEITVHSI